MTDLDHPGEGSLDGELARVVPTQGGRGLRETVTEHRCQCLITRAPVALLEDPSLSQITDHCGVTVDNPDQPFCERCEDRHPDFDDNPGVLVTVWGLA